jgi:N-acetylglucosamine-6-phosphate deacetylase
MYSGGVGRAVPPASYARVVAMNVTERRGVILTPDGPVRGRIRFDETVLDVGPAPDAPERWILPGFIDAHVHGGGGGDTMDGPDGVRALARFHGRHGTTSLLATTITAPWPEVMAALAGVAGAMADPDAAGAAVIGAHLEGPFISPRRLGAQPPHTLDPLPELVDAVLAWGVVRVVTLAPELPGARSAAARFARAGVRVSLGHTGASSEEVADCIAAVRAAGGTLGFTHLFNAMGGMQGREPGVVGAALADPEAFAELILDGHHVHPTAFLAARRALGERLLLVTDAIRAAGTDADRSELGGLPITIEGGAARTQDAALAGSLLTLDAALRRAVALGVPVEDASAALSEAPARYLGLQDRGRLAPGLRADLVVLTPDLQVESVYVAGRELTA